MSKFCSRNRETEDDLVAISVSEGHLAGNGGSFVNCKRFALEEVIEPNRGSHVVVVGNAPDQKLAAF
jgi:hypothetical protein